MAEKMSLVAAYLDKQGFFSVFYAFIKFQSPSLKSEYSYDSNIKKPFGQPYLHA